MDISVSDKARLVTLLEQLECSGQDSDLYLHCLQTGPESIQEIARKRQVKRSTTHSAVQRLVEKGLLLETRRGKRRLVDAKDPTKLDALIEKKQQELEVSKANLEYLSQVLAAIRPVDHTRPTVKFYEGVDGLKLMLEESLEAKKEVLVFTHVDIFSELLDPDYLEKYFQRRAAKGISTRLIFPPCDFANRVHAKKEKYKITIRLMPKGLHWQSGIFAWNNKLAIKSFTEGKITCTVIENVDIAHFYKKILFELCWQQATPM